MTLFRTLAISLLISAGTFAACGEKEPPGPKPSEAVSIDSPYFLTQDKVVSVNDMMVRYRDEGPKDAPVLVMVHGFSASLETWDALADDLSEDYRVIRMDLSGHGLTGPDTQKRYSNEDTVAFLNGFLGALEIDQATLIGSSLGGLVSWRTALSHPDMVESLVLIAPGGFSINGVTEKPQKVPPMVKLYFSMAPKPGVKQATEALYGDAAKMPDGRIDTIIHMMKRDGNGEALIERAEMFTLPDPSEDLEQVNAQTLILWGDKDIMVPPTHGPQFAALMPNASLKTYPNAGHVPHEEIPETVAHDIRTFLKP